jgi:hypothetical protein
MQARVPATFNEGRSPGRPSGGLETAASASKIRTTHVSIDVTSLAIEELPALIKDDVEDFLENHPRSPAARLRPRMGMVGEIWLAFIGPKLRTGASGLGQTPRAALEDFNRHFMEPLISSNGSEPH